MYFTIIRALAKEKSLGFLTHILQVRKIISRISLSF
jgi:hypothetical protein